MADRAFAAAVIEKCEATFIAKASKAREASYRRESEACDIRYDDQGPAGVRASRAAICRANVAARYSGK